MKGQGQDRKGERRKRSSWGKQEAGEGKARIGKHRQGPAAWPSRPGQAHARSSTLGPAAPLPHPQALSPQQHPQPLCTTFCSTPPLTRAFLQLLYLHPRPMPISRLTAPLHLRPGAHLSSLRHLSSLHPNVHVHLLWMGCTSAASRAVLSISLNPEWAQRLPGEGAWRTLLREPLLFHHPESRQPLKMGSRAVTPGGEVPGPSQQKQTHSKAAASTGQHGVLGK